jgi:hypothetical protein
MTRGVLAANFHNGSLADCYTIYQVFKKYAISNASQCGLTEIPTQDRDLRGNLFGIMAGWEFTAL